MREFLGFGGPTHANVAGSLSPPRNLFLEALCKLQAMGGLLSILRSCAGIAVRFEKLSRKVYL